MAESVEGIETTCTECKTALVVVPPTMGQPKRPEDVPHEVQLPTVPGARLVEANQEGRFVCPNCQAENEVSELRLS